MTQFRNWITPDGQPGPIGQAGFKAESGRDHLYVSLACSWTSRTLIMRKLKGLEEHISLSIVNPFILENGRSFAEGAGVIEDSFFRVTTPIRSISRQILTILVG